MSHTPLTSPLDGEPLSLAQKHYHCPNGHQFDIARQGYVNLLPVQFKRSRDPGDSKAMVAARTQLLESGLYAPIAARLNQIVTELATGKEHFTVLDAGCGEGYYTAGLHQALACQHPDLALDIVGLDISKWAVAAAAKRSKEIRWVVGSNKQPPLPDHSVDLIICAFGFVSIEGFCRVLKPGGRLLLLDPGPNHLLELREVVYQGQVKRHQPASLQALEEAGFSDWQEQELCYQSAPLQGSDLAALLAMTPHLYRAPKAGKEAAAALESLALSIDVSYRWAGIISSRDLPMRC